MCVDALKIVEEMWMKEKEKFEIFRFKASYGWMRNPMKKDIFNLGSVNIVSRRLRNNISLTLKLY